MRDPNKEEKAARLKKLGEAFCLGTVKDSFTDKLQKSCDKVTIRSSGDIVNEGVIEEVIAEENEDISDGSC